MDHAPIDKAADAAIVEHIGHAVLTPVGAAMKLGDGTVIQRGYVDLDGDGHADGTFVSVTHTKGHDSITETRFELIVNGHEADCSVLKVVTDAGGSGQPDRLHEEVTGAGGHKVLTEETVFASQGHVQSTDQSTYDDAAT